MPARIAATNAKCAARAARRLRNGNWAIGKENGPFLAARFHYEMLIALTAGRGQVLRRDRRAGLAIPRDDGRARATRQNWRIGEQRAAGVTGELRGPSTGRGDTAHNPSR